MSEQIFVAGPVGQLEAQINDSPAPKFVAVLCHPHSQYGGSMHDGVLEIMVDALGGLGVNTVRFNFRSVGQSEGEFDQGEGEIQDVLAMAAWAENRWPGLPLILGGYSFGAAMSLIAASRIEDKVSKLILIAPPIQMIESDAASSIDTCVIVGSRDTIVSASAAAQYFKPDQLKLLPQADHFFADSRAELTELIQGFMNAS